MTHSREQLEEHRWFRGVVEQLGLRYRVSDDVEGWPLIPGRRGAVEWGGDRTRLTVYTTKAQALRELLAIRGVRRWQMGTREWRLWFDVDLNTLAEVCRVIRARVRRTRGNPEALARARARRLGTGPVRDDGMSADGASLAVGDAFEPSSRLHGAGGG